MNSISKTEFDFIELLALPIIVFRKRDGAIVKCNNMAQDALAMSSRALTKITIIDLIANTELGQSFIESLESPDARVFAYEVAINIQDGNSLIADIALNEINNSEFATMVFWPKSRSGELLENLHIMEKDRSFGQIGRSLAHEVKNPLAGIRGAAQLLLQDARNEQKPLATLIIDETDRIHRLIDKVESLGFDNKPNLIPINIHAILERVISLIENEFGGNINITREFDVSLPMVLADTDALTQIFLNLAKNAAQALNEKSSTGNINFSTKYRHGLKLINQHGKSTLLPIEIIISDNGFGIPAELTNTIFDPFITTKSDGTGLGLALVRKLVGSLDGQIEFDSIPGRTRFKVRLASAQNNAI